jgi:PII-like signaling protein
MGGHRHGKGDLVKSEGEGTLVRVFIGENDSWGGKPLSEAIVLRAREAGLAGATVVRGVEGYGASSRLHTTRLLELSSDLPIVIEIVDETARIDAFLPTLDEVVGDGLITTERVHVVTYRGTPRGT